MALLTSWPKPDSNIFIYALLDPDTDQIRYIGQTILGLERFQKHYKDFRPSKLSNRISKSKYWIRKLKSEGKVFKVIYLKYCEREELNYWEQFYIKEYKHLNLLNLTEGGHTSTANSLTEEDKKEISRRTKEAMWRPDIRKRFLEGTKKRIMPAHYKVGCDEKRKQLISNSPYHNSKKIQVIDSNGIIYESLQDAANKLGVSKQAITQTLKGKQKTCAG